MLTPAGPTGVQLAMASSPDGARHPIIALAFEFTVLRNIGLLFIVCWVCPTALLSGHVLNRTLA